MIRHLVFWKFRPGTEEQQTQFLEGLQGLMGVVPQLKRCEVSRAMTGGTYDAMLLSEFDDLAALEAYRKDPRHQALSALCKSIEGIPNSV